MPRIIGALAIAAAVLVVVLLLIGQNAFEMGAYAPASSRGYRSTVEPMSFALGFLAGLVAIWVSRVPWGDYPRLVMQWIIGWRRSFVMLSLADAFTGVLLFY